MKNIWYISKYVSAPFKSKVGSRSYYIAQAMANAGHDVTIFTSDSNHLTQTPEFDTKLHEEFWDKVRVVWVRTLKYKKSISLLRILSWLDFEQKLFRMNWSVFPKPDVIIASSLSLMTVLTGIYLKKRFNVPLIFEVRDIWPLTLTAEGGFSKYNPFVFLLSQVEKLGYKHADRIVGTMPNLQQHVHKVTGKNLQVYCVPMGFDSDKLKRCETPSNDFFDSYIPKDKFVIMYAGSIGHSNALEPLFEAANLLVNQEHMHFVVVGNGDLKDTLRTKYGNLPNVTFTPAVSQSQVIPTLQKSDVLYFSTFSSEVWEYGQSLNKLVDYMLSGKMIVGSYSGYPSMISEAQCGHFVEAENENALAECLLQLGCYPPDEVRRIGKRGQTWIEENRTYDKLAQDYLHIINQLWTGR